MPNRRSLGPGGNGAHGIYTPWRGMSNGRNPQRFYRTTEVNTSGVLPRVATKYEHLQRLHRSKTQHRIGRLSDPPIRQINKRLKASPFRHAPLTPASPATAKNGKSKSRAPAKSPRTADPSNAKIRFLTHQSANGLFVVLFSKTCPEPRTVQTSNHRHVVSGHRNGEHQRYNSIW
jgi:hypothetical protein